MSEAVAGVLAFDPFLRLNLAFVNIGVASECVRPGVPPSGSAGCAPRPVPGRGHAASIPDAFGRRLAPGLRAALALSHACFCSWAGLLFPSSLHTVLAVKVCAHSMRWRPFGRLRTCDCCAAACRFRSRAIPP
jgi:hypothetical protein